MGTGCVKLPFLTDDEVIGLAARKRIAAAFGRVAEARNVEKKNLRTQQKMADVWSDGYLTLSNLRELNVRTLRNELDWPMLLARQFVRIVTAMSFVEQRGVAVGEWWLCAHSHGWSGARPRAAGTCRGRSRR